jgi:prephenate dehydratase
MFYVDATYQHLTRYRHSIDAIVPLTKELQILGEYKKSEISGNR